MIKRFKLWQRKRKLKQHQGFSKETNEFIQRVVDHINSDKFKDSDIEEQIELLMAIPPALQALEVIVQMNKMFNQFFDIVNANRSAKE